MTPMKALVVLLAGVIAFYALWIIGDAAIRAGR
jgi:hypothetical protein